jgi:hypothetical protein
MAELDLAGVRERADRYASAVSSPEVGAHRMLARLAQSTAADVPALLDEIERLRRRLESFDAQSWEELKDRAHAAEADREDLLRQLETAREFVTSRWGLDDFRDELVDLLGGAS